jgi:putative RecB family exonuclease
LPVYSHSCLSTFEKCPLQYRFRYIDRIRRDTQGIEAFMGNRVHEVLERLYRDLLASRRPSLDELVALYRRNWEAEYSANVRIVRTERTADHYRQAGERCLEDYYRRYEPFDQAATIGLEERVLVTFERPGAPGGEGPPAYQIQGYIDRLARAGAGVYEIHDYKTSATLPSDVGLKRDRQLTLYLMAVLERFPEARDVRLIWHYLAFDRELSARRSPGEIDQHRRQAIGVIEAIEVARDYPPRESPLCRWCEYRDICPAQMHLVRAEAGPARAAAPAAPRRPRQINLFE